MKNVKFEKLLQIETKEETFTLNKKIRSFIKSRLQIFKQDLIKSSVLLNYNITNETLLDFQILAFKQTQAESIKKSLIDNFLKKAVSKVIEVRLNDDFSKIEKIVNEFKESIDAISDEKIEVSSVNGDENCFDFSVGIEIIFNKELKKIFLNGTDSEELDEIKKNLEEKINGSKKLMKSIKYPILVFKGLVIKNFLDRIKPKFLETKFFVNYKQNIIRLTGPNEQVENVSTAIDQIASKISDEIVTMSIQANKSELAYLENCKNELDALENSLVRLSSFEIFGSLCININKETKITLIHGDLTKLCVDAYINPANSKLLHSGGLAKAIARAGGKTIE